MTIFSTALCQDNLARDHPTYQSITMHAKEGKLAADGIMLVNWDHCSQAGQSGEYAWWSVKLNRFVSVEFVSVTIPAWDNKPINASILVTNSSDGRILNHYDLCGIITQQIIEEQKRHTIFIRCSQHTVGNSVVIISVRPVLVLCEVQVFPFEERERNVALGKKAGYHPPGTVKCIADRATDGNNNNNKLDACCSETSSTRKDAFWYVDLEGLHRINAVEITIPKQNGTIPQKEVSQLVIGHIYVTEKRILTSKRRNYNALDKCSDIKGMQHGKTTKFFCSEPLFGRLIYIQHKEANSIGLCEVRVFGYAVRDNSGSPTAPRMPATSSGLATTLSTDHGDMVTYTISSAENTSFKGGSQSISASHVRKTVIVVLPTAMLALVVAVIFVGLSVYCRKSWTKRSTSSNVKDVKEESAYEEVGFPDDYENPNQDASMSPHAYTNTGMTVSDKIANGHPYEQLELSHSNTEQSTLANGQTCENENKYDKLHFSL